MNCSILEVNKSDSHENSDGEKEEGTSNADAKKSLAPHNEDERKISIYLPSQELTLHSVKSSEYILYFISNKLVTY